MDLAYREEGPFQRLYAIKRLHSMFDEPGFRQMFLEEARVAGLVRHANVVSVLDVGEDAEGPYLVMEFIEGLPLHALLKDAGRQDEHLPVQLVCRIVAQVAAGVHAAHELTGLDGESLELVHRDISPQNVLIGFDGIVRVTDFGVAKALGRETRTATGTLKGKLGYMSPEQLSFRDVDRRSDLFSIGVVLFECLSLKRLYAGDKGPASILYEPVPDIGDYRKGLPPRLVELSMQLLAKKPTARPRTAAEVAERLEDIAEELSFDEDSARLVHYLDARYKDRREAFEKEVRSAVSQQQVIEPTVVEEAPRRPRSRVAVGAGLVLLGVGAGAVAMALPAAWTTTDPREQTESAGVVRESPTVVPATAPTKATNSPDSPPELREAAVDAIADAEHVPSERPMEVEAEQTREPQGMRRRGSRLRMMGDAMSDLAVPSSSTLPIETDW